MIDNKLDVVIMEKLLGFEIDDLMSIDGVLLLLVVDELLIIGQRGLFVAVDMNDDNGCEESLPREVGTRVLAGSCNSAVLLV